jgi:hypothetical protein
VLRVLDGWMGGILNKEGEGGGGCGKHAYCTARGRFFCAFGRLSSDVNATRGSVGACVSIGGQRFE